jgi:hypothetical protein
VLGLRKLRDSVRKCMTIDFWQRHAAIESLTAFSDVLTQSKLKQADMIQTPSRSLGKVLLGLPCHMSRLVATFVVLVTNVKL